MALWGNSITENGVEVNYSSNCEMYHLTNSSTGEYDVKIDVYPNHIESYVANDSYWEEHDHYHTDSEGCTTEVHGMDSRSWGTTCRS